MPEEPTPNPASPRRRRPPFRQRLPEPPDGFVAVGHIAGPHGLRGELKVEPLTDFPEERFAPGSRLRVAGKRYTVRASRPHKGRVLLELEGIDSAEKAEWLRDELLVVPESELAALPPDTYYRHDLLGMSVVTTTGETLGTVTDVMEMPANDVYVVQTADGEALVPAIGDIVLSVDVAERRITIDAVPGLLPEPGRGAKAE